MNDRKYISHTTKLVKSRRIPYKFRFRLLVYRFRLLYFEFRLLVYN